MTLATDCAKLFTLGLESFARIRPTESGCLVTTSNLYPSGRAVQVLVESVRGEFRLTDGAQALREIRQSGIETQRPGDYISPAAKRRGVLYGRGEVYATDGGSNIPLLVKLVANASSDAVIAALEGYKLPRLRSFKFAFNSYMKETFGDKFKPETVSGEVDSYKLDYVYKNGKTVIADPITADAMSVDRAFRIHSDIHGARVKSLSQWLIYDATDPWRKADLDLLGKTGARVVPYEAAAKDLPSAVK